YVEIPSLMQACVVTKDRLSACLGNNTDQGFKDDAMWCIDQHFWLMFHRTGGRLGRTRAGGKFRWRQHPGQQTRTHGRLSLDVLRQCKLQFLVADLVGSKVREVRVVGVGKTLKGWAEDVAKELREQGRGDVAVTELEWKDGGGGGGAHVVKLFAFGMENARRKVRQKMGAEWDDQTCFFVA
ncbi:hypothetical protein TeGR_g1969, partial [Tetraparma gracilis]